MPYLQINSRDSRIDESLFQLWEFLNDTYPQFKQSYKAFASEVLYADGNYVIRINKKASFYFTYLSDGFHNLVVNLMAGNCKEAILYALALSIYVILNNGHDGLVFHVKADNSNMLGIVKHAGMTEQDALKPGFRSFKCSSTHLIKRFGSYYHRFLLSAPSLNIEFFRQIGGTIYIARGWNAISGRHYLFESTEDRIIYLKNKHITLHGSSELLPHLFDSNYEDGISLELTSYLLNNKCNSSIDKAKKLDYHPIDAIILPTSGCNLGCRYCYSEASPQKKSYLDFNKGKIGIDFIFENAKHRNEKKVFFSFLGGGEPLVAVDLDYALVEYIREREKTDGIKANISICTNGTIYNEKVCNLLRLSNQIQFSFDGTSKVQNRHRPFANGESTFQIVSTNIRRIKKDFPHLSISVRTTVSDYSVDEMPRFVEYLSEIGVKHVAFEPLIVTGRAVSNTSLSMPDLTLFAKSFIEAQKVGIDKNVDVSCSASAVYRKSSFCGATYNNFVITPDGLISTCVEVSSLDDPLADKYIIGNIENDNVNINNDILQRIRDFDEIDRVECQNCIAEKSCRGNCPVRTMRFGTDNLFINELCIMQTKLLIHKISYLHKIKERTL